ncbi:MAG: TolC family protein [Candidatus Latescibacteria bacterium]|nr:TolC family protein [Candidatus Latescibacterota bacterium]
MQRLAVALLLAALLTPWRAGAEEVLSLQALIDEALEKNPEILRAQQMWEMARAKAPQVKALPDPMLQLELQNIGLTDYTVGEMDMSMAGVSVSQPIPYPGKRRLRQQKAEKEAEAEAEMVEVAQRSVVSQLKVAYYDLAFTYQSLEVVERTRAVLREFEQTARTRYSVGQGMQQDVLKAQVELSMLVQKSAALEQRQTGISAMLNSLLDRPPDAALGRPDTLSPPRPLLPPEELARLTLEHNPELRNRQRGVEAGELEVALMRKEYRPDFAVSAGWRSRGGFDDLYQVMVEVELPWQRERRRYGVQEALAGREAALRDQRATEEMALAQVRDLASMAATALQLVALYQTAIIPQATFSLESALAAYRVGQVDFLMLLDNARALLDNELMVQEQLTDYHRAVARLEEVVGALVEQKE